MLKKRITLPYTVEVIQSKKVSFQKRTGLLWLMALILSECTVHGPTKVIVLREGEVLVQPGDTIYTLAHRHGIPVRMLVQSNGLVAPYILVPDQKLIIPGSPPQPVEPLEDIDPPSGPSLIEKEEVEWYHQPLNQPPHPGINQPVDSSPAVPTKGVTPVVTPENHPSRSEKSLEKIPEKPKKSLSEKKSFSFPTQGKIISKFGEMMRGAKNTGIYFKTEKNDLVRAAAPGVVILVGDELKKGFSLVVIQHHNGVISAYGPFESTSVQMNQKVLQQAPLGKVKGSELYFEMRKDRQIVDPLNYLR